MRTRRAREDIDACAADALPLCGCGARTSARFQTTPPGRARKGRRTVGPDRAHSPRPGPQESVPPAPKQHGTLPAPVPARRPESDSHAAPRHRHGRYAALSKTYPRQRVAIGLHRRRASVCHGVSAQKQSIHGHGGMCSGTRRGHARREPCHKYFSEGANADACLLVSVPIRCVKTAGYSNGGTNVARSTKPSSPARTSCSAPCGMTPSIPGK